MIYCRTSDGVPASAVQVVNRGPTLHTWAIDAAQPPHVVAAELAQLAERIARPALGANR